MLSELFSASWANAVQLGALPLGLVGLLLTWIEVRRPRLAARISNLVLELGRIPFGGRPIQGTGPLALRMFTVIHFFAVAAFWAWFLLVGASMVPSAPLTRFAFALAALAFPVASAFVLIRVVAAIVSALSAYSRGHPLGALGLLLALVGVIAEIYQVGAMLTPVGR